MAEPRLESLSSLDDFGTEQSVAAPSSPSREQGSKPAPLSTDKDGWEDEPLSLKVGEVADPEDPANPDNIPPYLYQQPLEDGVTQYEIQRGCTVDGKTYRAGDVIKVQCRFCVLWNREWMGKIRCCPGRTLNNGTIMTADRFSCEQYFLCKEMEPEFRSFLTLSRPAVTMVKQLIPAARHVLELERWARRFLKRYPGTSPAELFKTAKDFLSSFNSLPQLVLIESFVRDYSKLQTERDAKLNKRKGGRPPMPHGQGDLVTWLEPELSSVIKGVIVKRARGQLVVLCIDGPDQLLGQKLRYNYDEWRQQKKPTIIRKAVDAVVKAHS
jgi:hypothetical protein